MTEVPEKIHGLPPGGPIVVLGTPGSGTRAVARLLVGAGVYMGELLTSVWEPSRLVGFADRLTSVYLARDQLPSPFRAAILHEMQADLAATLRDHVAHVPNGARWGWKHPRSILILPFLDAVLPEMSFIHVIRDGRDMALSGTLTILERYSNQILRPGEWDGRDRQLMRIWARVNHAAADYADSHMPDRYLLVRFEDLCREPRRSVEALSAFCGLQGDVEALARLVRPPASLGRWRRHGPVGFVSDLRRLRRDRSTRAELTALGETGLRRLGYL